MKRLCILRRMAAEEVLVFGIIGFSVIRIQSIQFENCYEGFISHGGCTVVERDGAVGLESINSVKVENDYLDFGEKSGCPYDVNSCSDGFNFYGWVKFLSHPSTCFQYGVLVSANQFNIHILGNGHIAVYVWMESDREWYAETVQPVILNVYYPIVLQYFYNPKEKEGSIQLIMQGQLSAIQNCSRPRTYKPPSDNFIFAGDGVNGNFANVQLDRINLDGPVSSMDLLMGKLVGVRTKKSNCLSKSHSVLIRSYTCFWLESTNVGWSGSYKACNNASYDASYPYGRLARFPNDNITVWNTVAAQITTAGTGAASGYLAWIGGGSADQWLNAAMTPVEQITYPPDVVRNESQTGGGTCMALNTKISPWQWVNMDCNSTVVRYRLCEMSWDCLMLNPCQNLGACNPVTDGPTCTCFGGTSGKYCEKGIVSPTCVNNCIPCTTTPLLTCNNQSTTTRTTSTIASTDASVSISSRSTLPIRKDLVQHQPELSPTVVGRQSPAPSEIEIIQIIEEYNVIIEEQFVEIFDIETLLDDQQIQYDAEFEKRIHKGFEDFWKDQKSQNYVTEIRLHTACKKMLMVQVNDRIIEELASTVYKNQIQMTQTIEQRRYDIMMKEKHIRSRNSYFEIRNYFEQFVTEFRWQKFYETIYMDKSLESLVSKGESIDGRNEKSNLNTKRTEHNGKSDDSSEFTSKDEKYKNSRHKGKGVKRKSKSQNDTKSESNNDNRSTNDQSNEPIMAASGGLGKFDINSLVNGLTSGTNNRQGSAKTKSSNQSREHSLSRSSSISSSSSSSSYTESKNVYISARLVNRQKSSAKRKWFHRTAG